MAKRLHCSVKTISNYEKGKTKASYAVLMAYADHCGVDLAYLLGEVEPPLSIWSGVTGQLQFGLAA